MHMIARVWRVIVPVCVVPVTVRVPVAGGPHEVGVTFPKDPSLLLETERKPFNARFNMHRHPRTVPAFAAMREHLWERIRNMVREGTELEELQGALP